MPAIIRQEMAFPEAQDFPSLKCIPVKVRKWLDDLILASWYQPVHGSFQTTPSPEDWKIRLLPESIAHLVVTGISHAILVYRYARR